MVKNDLLKFPKIENRLMFGNGYGILITKR